MATTHFARSETTLTTHNALAERLTDFTTSTCFPEIALQTLSALQSCGFSPHLRPSRHLRSLFRSMASEGQVATSDRIIALPGPGFHRLNSGRYFADARVGCAQTVFHPLAFGFRASFRHTTTVEGSAEPRSYPLSGGMSHAPPLLTDDDVC